MRQHIICRDTPWVDGDRYRNFPLDPRVRVDAPRERARHRHGGVPPCMAQRRVATP